MPKPNCLTAGDPPSWDSADARGVKDWQPQPAWNYQDVLSGMRQGTDGRLGEGDGKGGLGAADKGLRQLWPGLSCRLGVEKRAKRRERVGWAAPINVGEKKIAGNVTGAELLTERNSSKASLRYVGGRWVIGRGQASGRVWDV